MSTYQWIALYMLIGYAMVYPAVRHIRHVAKLQGWEELYHDTKPGVLIAACYVALWFWPIILILSIYDFFMDDEW